MTDLTKYLTKLRFNPKTGEWEVRLTYQGDDGKSYGGVSVFAAENPNELPANPRVDVRGLTMSGDAISGAFLGSRLAKGPGALAGAILGGI